MARITGGCLCGAVRYEADASRRWWWSATAPPAGGTRARPFRSTSACPRTRAAVTGDALATSEDRSGASGKPFERAFCSRCGSPIAGRGEAYPGLVSIKAGTLDDPSRVKPAAHIWCAEKQPWVAIEAGVAQMAGGPGS